MTADDFIPAHLKLAATAAAMLPLARIERTLDIAEVILGNDDEGTVVLLFLPEELDVRHRVVSWPQTHTPVMTSQRWKRMKYDGINEARLLDLVIDAKKTWAERLRECMHCEERFPPERVIGRGKHACCHGCAEQHEGVVF